MSLEAYTHNVVCNLPQKNEFPFNGNSGFYLSIDMKEMSQEILNLNIKF